MINLKDMIHTIRGKQVILDKDLAELYEVDTRTLNRAVKRNTKKSEIFCVQEILNFFA